MKISRTITLAIAIALSATSAWCGIDAKLYRKTAEKVWSRPDSLFRADTPIPDSIAANASAVIIMRLDEITTSQQTQNTIYKADGRTNRTLRQHLRRTMVKLLDQKAVEDYGETEFGEKANVKFHGLLLYEAKQVFGARIHKPDGSIINIDVPANAIEIAHGKKENKDVKYKIAIPGLAVGDVFEYFFFDDELAEEFSLDHIDLPFYDKYPIMNRVVSMKMSPYLTTEYRTYNGAPRLNVTQDKDENYCAQIHVIDIPAVDFSLYVMPKRQLPFIRLQTLNNSTYGYHAPSSRRTGFYTNILPGKYYREIGEIVRDAEHEASLPGKAAKIAKNYMKAHPELTPQQKVDIVWLALQYSDAIDDDDYTPEHYDLWKMLFLIEAIDKSKALESEQAGIAFINPRNDVPVKEPSAWYDVNFVTTAGNCIYYSKPQLCYMPGEDPALFQGETGYMFNVPRKNITMRTMPIEFTVNDLKHIGNRIVSQASVDIDPNTGAATISGNATYTGGCKELAGKVTDMNEWIACVENYLGISKKYVDKEYDAIEREHKVRETISKERKFIIGVQPDSVKTFSIDDRGILPGSEGLKITAECDVSELATPLGADLNVHAGRLIGAFEKIAGAERTPLLDAMMPTAHQYSRTVTIHIPEGYTVDETSLQGFAVNVNKPIGQFAVQAKINADGDLEIVSIWRIKLHTIALHQWQQLLDLSDAAAAATEKSILLTHK